MRYRTVTSLMEVPTLFLTTMLLLLSNIFMRMRTDISGMKNLSPTDSAKQDMNFLFSFQPPADGDDYAKPDDALCDERKHQIQPKTIK